MSNTQTSALVELITTSSSSSSSSSEQEGSETEEYYRKLDEKCGQLLDKLKARKNKKNNRKQTD